MAFAQDQLPIINYSILPGYDGNTTENEMLNCACNAMADEMCILRPKIALAFNASDLQ